MIKILALAKVSRIKNKQRHKPHFWAVHRLSSSCDLGLVYRPSRCPCRPTEVSQSIDRLRMWRPQVRIVRKCPHGCPLGCNSPLARVSDAEVDRPRERLRADGVTLAGCLGTGAARWCPSVRTGGWTARAWSCVRCCFHTILLSGGLRENLAASLSLRLGSTPDSPPLVSLWSSQMRLAPTSAPSRGAFSKLCEYTSFWRSGGRRRGYNIMYIDDFRPLFERKRKFRFWFLY